MTEFDLLNKTELKIAPVFLNNANLTHIAAAVACSLEMDNSEVLVVDYRNGSLVLDILNSCVNAYKIVGKKETLIESLLSLPGVTVSENTKVLSNGMLGWIALDNNSATEALRQSEKIVSEILGNISKRMIVFSSGAEVLENEIEDTNTPTIINHFKSAGYNVDSGEVLKDDKLLIAAKLREAAEAGGYGVIITTGGVGAEDKDHTVEAVKAIDPDAATPYICHFKIGTGRHVKDGVKIAVGEYNGTRIIALPGPNDEVRASLGPIVHGLKTGIDKKNMAEMIAANLRQILRGKMKGRHQDAGCQLHGQN
jgi:molybdenum cofactor synthesis domain-containing protein